MKIRYLKLKSWLLAALGGLLGVGTMISCENGPFACEYGCPEATYHVKGTVTDEQGHPIVGIGILETKRWDEADGTYQPAGYGDTTDKDGRYSLDYPYAFPGEPLSLDVHDIDGAANGSYNDTVVTINTESVELTGGNGHWYEGEGDITYNITLTEKTE
jgi:putative lipoprotein (rSAM/lipoprotein system)